MRDHGKSIAIVALVALVLAVLAPLALAATTPTVSLKAAASSVASGKPLKLTGTVLHAVKGHLTVWILQRAKQKWHLLKSVKMNSKGKFSATVMRTKKGPWHLRAAYYVGKAVYRSPSIVVTVK